MNNGKNLRSLLVIIITVLLVGTMAVLSLLVLLEVGDESTDVSSLVPSNASAISETSEDGVSLPDSSQVFDTSEYSSEASDTSDISDISDISDVSEVSTPVEEIKHGWVINVFGYTYVYDDNGFEQFNYKNTALDRYVNSLNTFVKLVPETSRVFNMIAPVKSSFFDLPADIYKSDKFYNASQSAFVSTVESKLDSRITDIPIIGKLERNYDAGEYLFFRTDKNWTALGAYYAYTAFCEKSGITALSLSSFTSRASEGFLGNFYNATSSEEMYENPDILEYYYPYAGVDCSMTVFDNGRVYTDYRLSGNDSGKVSYDVFLGRDAARYEIKTSSDGGSLLVIGDTSVAAMLPFLASHYSEIQLINPIRYKDDINNLIAEKAFDDVLTICYTTSSISGDYVPQFNIAINGKTSEPGEESRTDG